MKIIVCVSLFFMFFQVQAKQYFVATNGLDANIGTTINSPWKTIAKVNAQMSSFLPGDSILFNAGDTFNGGLVVTCNGLFNNPIYFGKYGSGNNPIFIGTAPIASNSWVNLGGNIWRTYHNNNASNRVTGLFINGVKQSIGRFPNATAGGGLNGFDTISKITDSSFSGKLLPTSLSFVGAEFISKSCTWQAFQSKITNQSAKTISLNSYPGSYIQKIVNNWGYIIRNHINTLDLPGEWYFNEITDSLYLYTTSSPSNQLVEVTNINNLIFASRISNIVIEEIQLSRSQAEACKFQFCNNIKINACNFSHNSNTAFVDNSTNNLYISNTTFINNTGKHLSLTGTNIFFNNNILENNALNFGDIEMASDYTISPLAFEINYLQNSTINNNSLKNCGYSGIGGFGQTNLTINENVIDSFNLVFDDGGGIYIHQANSNVLINNNFVSNGIGANLGTNYGIAYSTNGIYLDNKCSHVTVKANTISAVPNNAIFLQDDVVDNVIINNLVWSDKGAAFFAQIYNPTISNYNNKAEGNIFFSSSYYDGAIYSATAAVNKCNTNKNYYIKPFSDEANNYPIAQKYTIQEWYTLTGNDLNSKSSPIILPRYIVSSLNSNIITNGNFNTGITDWFMGKQGISFTGSIDWQSSDSVLKLSYSNLNQSQFGTAWLSARTKVNITSGQKYLLKFKYKGAYAKSPVSVMLSYMKSNISNGIITDTDWKQAIVILEANYTGEADLSIEANNSSVGTLYIDNVELIPVTANYTNINDFVKLYTNKTSNYSSINLPSLAAGMYYLDKDGYLVNPGSFTLSPFTSRFIFISNVKPTSSKAFRTSILFR
jgi:hypothetical protein